MEMVNMYLCQLIEVFFGVFDEFSAQEENIMVKKKSKVHDRLDDHLRGK